MIVHVHSLERISLTEEQDFRRFKVVVDLPRTALSSMKTAFQEIVHFADAETAWVKIDAVKKLAAKDNDQEWLKFFGRMVEGARPYGWISDGGEEIRAHVEWQ